MKKLTLIFVLLLGLGLNQVQAASKTGLASSLIKTWSSEVDKNLCPDFRYPSHQPSIKTGQKVYQTNCASCHDGRQAKEQLRKSTPEKNFEYLCGGNGDGQHKFSDKLTVDEMWDSLMYFRSSVLGYYKDNSDELADMNSIFGGNCAVCHGTRGQGDGNLHKSLYPPPANFTMFKRLYTRSDEKLFNEIKFGIPWTAMPAWYKRHDFDKRVDFDENMIWKLVRYVRQFGFVQDEDRLDKGRKNLEEYKKSIGEQ